MNILTNLKQLEQESISRNIPIIGPEKGAWLLEQIQEYQPQKILELGSANGYSGCILGSQKAELTTIELNEKIAKEAMENYAKFNINAKILIDDGVQIIKELNDSFDLIFIDFHLNGYMKVLEDCIRLLNQKGILIADNINLKFKGRDCQDFKKAILSDKRLKTKIVDIKDGLSSSKKISETFI
jgi:predicted O-methyltransferase YrrM